MKDEQDRTDSRSKRSSKRIGLLLVVACVVMVASIIAVRQFDHARAVAVVDSLGGHVEYGVRGPQWLRQIVTNTWVDRLGMYKSVISVSLHGPHVDDEVLVNLKAFRRLEELDLDDTQVTDAGLLHLGGFSNLEVLSIDNTKVTGSGLAHLKGLKKLFVLSIYDTDIPVAAVDDLVEAIPELEVGTESYLPAIHDAAMLGRIETIRELLAAGVPVDARVTEQDTGYASEVGTTPLTWPALRGQTETVKFLIGAGADVNAKNRYGITPLMSASRATRTITGDPLGCVHALLENGAEIGAVNEYGETAIFFACGTDSLSDLDEVPNRLRPPELHMPDPFPNFRPYVGGNIGGDYSGVPWRVQTALGGDAARLQALIDAGADIHHQCWSGGTPLEQAATTADAARVRVLLDAGAKVDLESKTGWDILEAAARDSNAEMFRLILGAADMDAFLGNQRGAFYVLDWAAASEEDAGPKVQELISRGVDIRTRPKKAGRALMHSLDSHTSSEAATPLLKAGADTSLLAENGDGVFLRIAKNGPAKALQIMLKRGSDPESSSADDTHPTALILATGSRRDAADKAELLIEAGADLESTDDKGATPLLAASRAGNMEAVVVLAEAGADVNVIDPEHARRTPLMHVANRGIGDIFMCPATGEAAVRALIENGADIDARDVSGETALTLAQRIGDENIVAALKRSEP